MSRVNTVLRSFGLSENEISVYLEILKQERTSQSKIAVRTKIPRTTVYDIVDSLVVRGLVKIEEGSSQNKISALSPTSLQDNIRDRFNELQSLQEDISSIIPTLLDKGDTPVGESGHEFFTGIEGARKTFFAEGYEDLITTRYVITDMNSLNTFGSEESLNKYPYEIKELVPLNDWMKFIFKKRFKDNPEFVKHREYKYIEDPILIQYTRTTIIGDKVLTSCAYKNESWGMIIDSKAYSESIKAFFNYLWLSAKPLTAEVIKSWPEITTPTGTVDSPSVRIEGGRVQKL